MNRVSWLIAILVLGLWATPVHAGCVVETSGTYAEGTSLRDDKCDTLGDQKTTLGTLLSGEDPAATGANTTGVVVMEFRYLNSGTKTTDFQVKATPGFVHNLVCIGTDAAATAGTIILYDNTTESAPAIFTYTVTAVALNVQPLVFPIDTVFSTGIYLGFTTTADVSCNVSYR